MTKLFLAKIALVSTTVFLLGSYEASANSVYLGIGTPAPAPVYMAPPPVYPEYPPYPGYVVTEPYPVAPYAYYHNPYYYDRHHYYDWNYWHNGHGHAYGHEHAEHDHHEHR